MSARPLRVWLVSPYGPIPGEGWRDHRYVLLGRALAARGHDVTWWTASFAHQFKQHRDARGRAIEVTPGFRIELVPTPGYRRNVGPGRLWYELVFAARTWRRARARLAAGRPDWVLAGEPPKAGGLVARALARRAGGRYAIDVYDTWPELWVTVAPRAVRPLLRAATRPLVALRAGLLRDADLVVAVNETYREVAVRAGARDPHAVYIGVEVAAVAGAPEAAIGDPVAIYAGTLGVNYDIPTLLAAAERLAHDGVRLRLLIAGDGPLAPVVRDAAARLPNVEFLGRLATAALDAAYGRAQIGIAAYGPASTVALPIKLFDYLAAGLPIVNSLPGEMADIVAGEAVGVNYRAGDPGSLAAALARLAGAPAERASMAARARAIAARFDVDVQYGRLVELLERPR